MATLNLGRIKPIFKGAYAGGTAYVVDDIVTSGNECFICILASTGNATSNATYWTKLAAKGTDGTDLTSTLTTQGDVAIRGSSAIERLGFGTSGYFLKTQGTGANPVWAAAGGGLQSLQVLTSGTTWTKPAGITKIKVTATGAGGSGGMGTSNFNAGQGGGAGATGIKLIDVSSISTITYSIGAGGTSVSSAGTNGVVGGNTVFGSGGTIYITANGGHYGYHADNNATHQQGATSTGGDMNIKGGIGGTHGGGTGADETMNGDGGSSYWGGGGTGNSPNQGNDQATGGQAYGSGGGGGYHHDGNTNASGVGAAGVIYIEEYA